MSALPPVAGAELPLFGARCPTRSYSPSHRLRVGRHSLPAFPLLGVLGLLAAIVVAQGTCAARGLSLAVQAGLIALAVATFLALALVTKLALGREALIYYHHEIAVLAVTALAAWALGAPVAAHLDAQALGLGAFLACGRLGCLCAGCCHGRPARRGGGVVYGAAHMTGGVAAHLRDVPLVPVQALEAAAVGALVVVAALASARPGAAFALYVSGYAVVRFALETQRGDACRPYRHGLSAAQWTSLAAMGTVALLAFAGALPDASVHLALAGALVLAAPLAARRRSCAVLDPRHVWELGRVLPSPAAGAEVRETSLGVRCSAGVHAGVTHYTLSRAGRTLTHEEADALALHILARRHDGAAGNLVARDATYHVLVHGPPAVQTLVPGSVSDAMIQPSSSA